MVCETEELEQVGWVRYPILLPRQWYLVKDKAAFHAIHIS